MPNLVGSKVVYARAHGTIKVPGAPQIGPELTSQRSPINKNVEMTIVEDGLLKIDVPDDLKKTKATIYVPLTNISHFVLADTPK